LAALRGSAEVSLSRERSAEELRQVLEQTIEHYNRLQRIAEDLLLLARADAGKNILHRERLLLNDVVADVVDLYGPLAEDRKLELRLHVGEAIWIDADGGRLKQLLCNLLDNAINYTPPCGQITVELKTRNGPAEIVVEDRCPPRARPQA
jgi:signal transduction histidine kinase